jgi:hypothetical protein
MAMGNGRGALYKAGRRLEYRVASILRKLGFTVTRAAGSHSPCDIIAYSPERCVHVQVKSRLTAKGAKRAGEELRNLVPDSCDVMIVAKGERGLLWLVREGDGWMKLRSVELEAMMRGVV